MISLNIPSIEDLNHPNLWKKLNDAHRYLGELKGLCLTLPNPDLLIDSLILREAKDSSEIENIITTHDDLYASQITSGKIGIAEKEVQFYSRALRIGYKDILENGILRLDSILKIQAEIEQNRAGLRRIPGTSLKNELTGETVYEPPQSGLLVEELMSKLVDFMHADSDLDGLDPIIRMAVAHHQFESIHPFYDGNGRTGRILNVLMLVKEDLLSLPVFYLSRYINQTKSDYYRLLQLTRTTGDWLPWCEYIVSGVRDVARREINFIQNLRELMLHYKRRLKEEFPKMYSQDLLNRLFAYPYTKITFLQNELKISRPTATKYLTTLANAGMLKKKTKGRFHYYVNEPLMTLLID